MAIALPTDAVARQHIGERECTACGKVQGLDEFEMTRDARGKHARRRVCRSCTATADSHLRSGLPIDVAAALTSVPVPVVRELHLAITAEHHDPTVERDAPTAATRVCLACKKAVPVTGYTRTPSGAHRRVCEACRTVVDRMLLEQAPIADIIRATGVTRPTITERRRELGMSGTRRTMSDETRQEILDLADDLKPAEIAARVGEKPRNVRRLLIREGVIDPAPANAPIDPVVIERARELLDDGAGYAETSRTVRVDVQTLRTHLPGYTRSRENRALIAWITMTPEVQALHREINRR